MHLALSLHCWPQAAEALRGRLVRDPYLIGPFVNMERWPPCHQGQQNLLSGLWLWPWNVLGPIPTPRWFSMHGKKGGTEEGGGQKEGDFLVPQP